MDRRMFWILLQIVSNPMTSNLLELSKKSGVSIRTIKNDISELNQFLNSQNIDEITIDNNGKLVLCEDRASFIEAIKHNDPTIYSYKMNKLERNLSICLILLCSEEFITIFEISEKLSLSRQTIINALKEVKEYTSTFKLEFISYMNKGLSISGGEMEKRHMLLSILFDQINDEQYINIMYPFTKIMIKIVFENMKDDKIKEIIKKVEIRYQFQFTEVSYQKILIALMLIIKRINISSLEKLQVKNNICSTRDIAIAMLNMISSEFNLIYNEFEEKWLCELLLEQSYMGEVQSSENVLLNMYITNFFNEITKELNFDLSNDYEFYQGLTSHINSSVYKKPENIPQNPIANFLEENYFEIYNIITKHIGIFDEFYHREVSQNEISYLVMHTVASMERCNNNRYDTNVLIICSGNVSVCSFLVQKLKKMFQFNIKGIISPHNISEQSIKNVDLILSTMAVGRNEYYLIREERKEYLEISLYLDDEDFLKIIDKLKNIESKSNKISEYKNQINEIMENYECIINKYVKDIDKLDFLSEIRQATTRFLLQNRDVDESQISTIGLSELFKEDKIIFSNSCKDYKQAIYYGGNVLLEAGEINQEYINAMIENVETYGNYFTINNEFAFPHADPKSGVIKTGVCLLILEEPVYFVDECMGAIKYVCCVAAENGENHKKVLFELVNMFKNTHFNNQFKTCNNSREVFELIQQYN